MANLFMETLFHYRHISKYLLHEFVAMPDHVHLILTPQDSLEKAIQFIKGGYSFRVKKELNNRFEVWQPGFTDHRIRDHSDYVRLKAYVHLNPVRARLCEQSQEYHYSSASSQFALDPVPQRLKPP
jgi:putative transposase